MTPSPHPMARGGGKLFVSFATEYTTIGDQVVNVPAGASQCVIECVGPGDTGYADGSNGYSGNGGQYAKKTISVAGLAALSLHIAGRGMYAQGTDSNGTYVSNNSTSAILCQALTGNTSGGVGDLINAGGLRILAYGSASGGGAGGPAGPGGNGSVGVGGTSSYPGAVGQQGTNLYAARSGYGGGGGSHNSGGTDYSYGDQGYVRLTWS